jgi:TolA-binding protein
MRIQKKSPTPTASDAERSLSDECSHVRKELTAAVDSMRTEVRVMQESIDALRDNLQRQIDAISSTGGKVPDIACQASYPARQDPET